MRIIMKFIFYISKKKTNRKGLAPIYGRITINGQRAEFSTGFFVDPGQWKGESLKGDSENNVLLNANLSKIRHDITQMYYYHQLKNKSNSISAETLKKCFIAGSNISMNLKDLMEEFVACKNKQIEKYSSYISYRLRYNIIIEYLNLKNFNSLMPEDFNEQKAQMLYEWLKYEKKYTNNYSVKVIMFLKSALVYACKIEQIDKSPLQHFFIKNDKPNPIIALDKIELAKLMKHKFASQRLQHVADLYIFQSYTGFCYADLFDFHYSDHVQMIEGNQWIFKKRVKVDSEAIVPLFVEAKKILEKYNYELPEITNQRYNAYLKEVGEIIGINKILTTHTARKTFAMIKLNEGFSIEAVAKMLGHSTTKVTQSTYAAVGELRIRNEMHKLKIA